MELRKQGGGGKKFTFHYSCGLSFSVARPARIIIIIYHHNNLYTDKKRTKIYTAITIIDRAVKFYTTVLL